MTTTYYSTVFALTLAMAGLNALAAEAVLIAAAAVMLLLHIDASTMVVGLDWGNPLHPPVVEGKRLVLISIPTSKNLV